MYAAVDLELGEEGEGVGRSVGGWGEVVEEEGSMGPWAGREDGYKAAPKSQSAVPGARFGAAGCMRARSRPTRPRDCDGAPTKPSPQTAIACSV